MRFFRGIAFQIWLPYALVFLLLLVSVSIYYPTRQESVFLEQKQKELTEIARSSAVGIELSLEAGNFAGLQKTIRYFAGSNQSVSIVALARSDGGGEEEVIAFFPPETDIARLRNDSAKFLHVGQPFRSTSFGGVVEVYIPRQILSDLLWSLNLPVYALLAVSFVITAFLFYFVALRVSQPISEITEYASGLIREESFQPVYAGSENEITILRNALLSLKESLDFQNEQNRRLTEGLESEVRNRTSELRQAVQKLSQAQNSARIGDFDFHRSKGMMTLSPVLPGLLGLDETTEVSLDDFLSVISPAAHDPVRTVLQEILPDGQKYSFDVRLKAGQRWVVLSAACHTDDDKRIIVTGTIQDISDRKLAEVEVQKLSLVARLSTNGILITDAEKRIQWANQSTEKLTGYTLAEMRGQSPGMFQFEETDQATVRHIKECLQQKIPVRTEILNRSRQGRKYWLELHIQPFFDDYGNLDGYLAIEVDITDRKRYEEELKSALSKEKELNQMKSRFITMTSHEFRTPLTTIQSNLELLSFHFAKNEALQDTKVDRYIGRLSKEVGRLTSLMNDILLLGRIDSGKMEFKPVPLHLDEILTDITQNQQFIAHDDRKITLETVGLPMSILADPVIINHVFFNVFSNAIKYSPGAKPPHCLLRFVPDRVLVTVRDFGLGIPADDLPHIFESFHRGSNVSTIQGTGLGLQITRQFVELHGGTIDLESEEGSGTTVTIALPAWNETAVG